MADRWLTLYDILKLRNCCSLICMFAISEYFEIPFNLSSAKKNYGFSEDKGMPIDNMFRFLRDLKLFCVVFSIPPDKLESYSRLLTYVSNNNSFCVIASCNAYAVIQKKTVENLNHNHVEFLTHLEIFCSNLSFKGYLDPPLNLRAAASYNIHHFTFVVIGDDKEQIELLRNRLDPR